MDWLEHAYPQSANLHGFVSHCPPMILENKELFPFQLTQEEVKAQSLSVSMFL